MKTYRALLGLNERNAELTRALFLVVMLCCASDAETVEDTAFTNWLTELKSEAAAQGVSKKTLIGTLDGLELIPKVLELQNRQPESTMSVETYLANVVSPARIQKGKRLLAEHAATLDEISQTHGIQPRFIVALWGLESDFGANTGGFPTIGSLATLAYAGRRRDYFRRELMAALKLVDRGEASAGRMYGSWAGAMGQCQFMPSNFLRHAVDYDEDGVRDIWGNPADVLASIAMLTSRFEWHGDQTWGREVRLPSDFDRRLLGDDARLRLNRWQALGVRRADGRDLPSRDLWSMLIQPDGAGTRAFIVYDNFHSLLRWNRSNHFALAVGHLADRLVQ